VTGFFSRKFSRERIYSQCNSHLDICNIDIYIYVWYELEGFVFFYIYLFRFIYVLLLILPSSHKQVFVEYDFRLPKSENRSSTGDLNGEGAVDIYAVKYTTFLHFLFFLTMTYTSMHGQLMGDDPLSRLILLFLSCPDLTHG
jgi:hypothetical protein